jgi:hypothetical protein
MVLTTHPLQVPGSNMGTAIPLLRSVTAWQVTGQHYFIHVQNKPCTSKQNNGSCCASSDLATIFSSYFHQAQWSYSNTAPGQDYAMTVDRT